MVAAVTNRRRCAAEAAAQGSGRRPRRGSATLDYFLVLCVVLPLAAFLFWIGPRIIHSVYDLFTVIVAGPFA